MRLKLASTAVLLALAGACWGASCSFTPSPSGFKHYTFTNVRYDKKLGAATVVRPKNAAPDAAVVGIVESPEIKPGAPFDHAIASWNATTPAGSYLTVYMQARVGGAWTRWYKMGLWNTDGKPERRKTFNDSDDAGGMDCEVLILKKKADAVKVRFELASTDGKTYPALRFCGVETNDSSIISEDAAPIKSVWGKELDVPYLSQQSVPGGAGWCSATSVTMVLRYWGAKLDRPELSNLGITDAAHGIHDAKLGGTGDWSFNCAYAGEYKGIRAYVMRFTDISQIEWWIARGVPVIVSVDYSKLIHRKGARAGHLMVARGFTSDGSIVVNDPDEPLTRSDHMRKVFSRADFESGWLGEAGSWGTVYIIHPEGWKL